MARRSTCSAVCALLALCATAVSTIAEPAPMDALDQVFSKRPPGDLAGAGVEVENVPVRKKSGNGVWIGFSARRQIFVVPDDPSVLEFLAVGARVTVHGTMRDAPAPSQARRIWAIDQRSAQRLSRARYYIDASSIQATI